mgnify:CR=1 FL=1
MAYDKEKHRHGKGAGSRAAATGKDGPKAQLPGPFPTKENMNRRQQTTKRIWEVDFLRGVALLAMVYYHIVYDLREFYSVPVSYSDGMNFYMGRGSALLFMLLAGLSCTLTGGNAKRGLKVLGLGLVITAITLLYVPSHAVTFGILHFLGTSMVLYPPVSRLGPVILALLGTAIFYLGGLTAQVQVPVGFLFPLGLRGEGFISSDYYPLLPWFGVFLCGAALGKLLYAEKRSLLKSLPPDTLVNKMGRHTLPIYLIHQPVILLVLFLLLRLTG